MDLQAKRTRNRKFSCFIYLWATELIVILKDIDFHSRSSSLRYFGGVAYWGWPGWPTEISSSRFTGLFVEISIYALTRTILFSGGRVCLLVPLRLFETYLTYLYLNLPKVDRLFFWACEVYRDKYYSIILYPQQLRNILKLWLFVPQNELLLMYLTLLVHNGWFV